MTASNDRPWLAHYPAGVPAEIDVDQYRSIPEVLEVSCEKYRHKPAYMNMGKTLTYDEVDRLSAQFASYLVNDLKLKKGDRVAIMLPNVLQYPITAFGILRAGLTVVNVNPLYTARELKHQLNDSGASAIVVLDNFAATLAEVLSSLPALKHVVTTALGDMLGFPKSLITNFVVCHVKKMVPKYRIDHEVRFNDALTLGSMGTLPKIDIGHEDIAFLQYTGGTTGVAKGAMLTHRNLVANTLQVRAWFANLANADGPDIIMGVLPLFHIYGMTTVMNFSIRGAGTMVLQPRFVVDDVLKAIQRERPHLLPGVPTMYMAINQAKRLGQYNLRSLKGAFSGAAPLPREVQARFEATTGARIVEGYGLTEASPVTHCTPLATQHAAGTIGVPMPGTDAAVFDQETGTRRMPPGEVGELAVRGPQVMLGYWKRADETARVLRDGWLFTGDLACVDESGYFTIVDRKKDMIISGGMNVYPRDVEEPLFQHPKVKEAVAVGIPDPRWGEAVKVYIVLRDGETATEQEILDYCHARMARYKVPKFVEFRRELPRSLVGKVLRRQLLDEEQARQASRQAS